MLRTTNGIRREIEKAVKAAREDERSKMLAEIAAANDARDKALAELAKMKEAAK